MSDFDKTRCAEGILAPDLNDEIRLNQEGTEEWMAKEHNWETGGTAALQGIHKQGECRCFWQASAPGTRINGSAFTSNDLGALWIDSGDNKIYILTATDPTWTVVSTELFTTFLASARTFLAALSIEMADPTLTLQNTDEEDTAGGRQSRIVIKGEQSGGEVTTLGWIEISHEGSSDDEKGQIKLYLNDGDDSNTPTLVMTIPSTGVAPTMAASTAPAADAQLANKKYVDDKGATIAGATSDTTKTATTQNTYATIASRAHTGANGNSLLIMCSGQIDLDWGGSHSTKKITVRLREGAANVLYTCYLESTDIYDAINNFCFQHPYNLDGDAHTFTLEFTNTESNDNVSTVGHYNLTVLEI